MLDWSQLTAAFQVLMIDLVLAGDNAVVIALAAQGVRDSQRAKVILIGIIGATVLRAAFALIATQLLAIVGLLLAGGILLLWVAWKLWREIREGRGQHEPAPELQPQMRDLSAAMAARPASAEKPPQKTLGQAAFQIVLADVSMSLDNVLAVAGAAREHPYILVAGLILSVALMGVAATFIGRLLKRYHWLVYVGLAIILYVALQMIWEGWWEVAEAVEDNGIDINPLN